jgi:ketosteroid isomerase-like protein
MTRPAHVMLLALCTAGAACQPSPTRSSIGRATLDSLNAALDTAFRAGDADRVAGYFSVDANLALIGTPDIKGRDAFASVLAPLFAKNTVAEHQFTLTEFEAYDSTAYERGTYTWASAPKGQSPIKVDRGRYSMVRRRSPSGQWLIVRYIENALPDVTSATTKP